VAEDGTLVVAQGAPAGAALALARVKHKRCAKKDGTVVTESVFTLWNKLKALELLGKKLKSFVERVEVENVQDTAYRELLKQIREEQQQGEK
jgi:hypothetical protein